MYEEAPEYVRWSQRRVGTRVRYSRIANPLERKESRTTPVNRCAPATRKATTHAHFPPGSNLRIEIVDRGAADIRVVARLRARPTIVRITSRQRQPAKEPHQYRVGESLSASGGPNPADAADSLACAFQEDVLILVGFPWMGCRKAANSTWATGRYSPWAKYDSSFQISGNYLDVRPPQSPGDRDRRENRRPFHHSHACLREKWMSELRSPRAAVRSSISRAPTNWLSSWDLDLATVPARSTRDPP